MQFISDKDVAYKGKIHIAGKPFNADAEDIEALTKVNAVSTDALKKKPARVKSKKVKDEVM